MENVITLSEMRDNKFSSDYGIRIVDGPMAGLMGRSVVILNEGGVVKYTELVPEITQEPNYEEALKNLKKID